MPARVSREDLLEARSDVLSEVLIEIIVGSVRTSAIEAVARHGGDLIFANSQTWIVALARRLIPMRITNASKVLP
jgi:hypothetical protein